MPERLTAQPRQRIEKAADLPRFNYRIDGKVEDVVRDDAKFKAVRRRRCSATSSRCSRRYEIPDKSVERALPRDSSRSSTILDGNHDAALARLDRLQALEEKPADKLMSGVSDCGADRRGTQGRKPRHRRLRRHAPRPRRLIEADLAPMPYEVVQNDVKEIKASAEIAQRGR